MELSICLSTQCLECSKPTDDISSIYEEVLLGVNSGHWVAVFKGMPACAWGITANYDPEKHFHSVPQITWG